MARHPDGGMYSIKLVHPNHLANGPLFTPVNLADNLPHLMNFSNRPHTTAIVENIPLHHKAIVYVMSPVKKFIWAIEYTGTVADGQQIANNHPQLMPPPSDVWFDNLLPISFLATIDPAKARDAQDVLQEAGVVFTPTPAPMQYISADEYQRIFNVIDWQWVASAEVVTV
jgi:hypothetical protein